mgnify:CR=1 FL=1
MTDNNQSYFKAFVAFMAWGFLVVCVLFFSWATGFITAAAMEANNPSHYADGYCAALNGTRLNDESCNVNGKVVPVVGP